MKSTVTLIHPQGLLSWKCVEDEIHSHSYPSPGTPLLTAAGLVRSEDKLGGGETGTPKLSDGSQEDCGPEAFGAWEKRETSASEWGTWSEHSGTTRVLSLLGFCPLSGILTNTSASPLPLNCKLLESRVSLFIFCILCVFVYIRALHTINSPAVCEGIGLPQCWVNPPSL